MLQNRVDPRGQIIRTAARGCWMGNRGLLHNDNQNIVRPFRLKAWITCLLEFNGRKREVMAPHRYTELFFLDEATAFAAGHRPCFECRRKDFTRFKSCWLNGNSSYGFNEATPVASIDQVLHRERIDWTGAKITWDENIFKLPDGTFVEQEGSYFVWVHSLLFEWSPFGYGKGVPPSKEIFAVLTPRSIVNAFRGGYVPQIKA